MSTREQRGDDEPIFSVLIGLVSTEDRSRILETLNALRDQEGGPHYEVVIGDRRQDDISAQIRDNYPETCLLSYPPSTSLPELRTAALRRARGQYVVVTEDHCVPAENWLSSMAQAFAVAPKRTAAVGGCVENGVRDTAFDWATFLCEYSYFLSPVCEGTTTVLPGMNVAYRRSVLADRDEQLLRRGFWETTLHPLLINEGWKLYSTNRIKLYHCKKFSFGLFSKQRFTYSRFYAALRVASDGLPKRLLAAGATVILPPLLLSRFVRQVLSKRRLRMELVSALPMLCVFVVIWAFGEWVGYLFGQGDALSKIE